jgi:REP element-mobilizing transposase RayT
MYIYMPTFCTTQKPVSQVFPNTCPLLPPVFLKELQTRKKIRIDSNHYNTVGAICSTTIALRDRRPLFEQPTLASCSIEVLKQHSAKTNVPIYAFCLMPDHVHLVLSASTDCDVITFIGQFKNLAQRAIWQQGFVGHIWQKRFYDHFLRSDEQLKTVIEYVLNNPVRRGLVEYWRDYPFCGSLVFEQNHLP